MMGIFTYFASTCPGTPLFDIFPTWYEYLPSTQDANGHCSPAVANLNDTWLIVAAAIDILLRLAAFMAIIFIIYAGIEYATSQGSPDQTAKAKSKIVNALIGLALAVTASFLVSFIAGSF